jgi:UDP-N-acetylglucosamine 3-dehydrogenase
MKKPVGIALIGTGYIGQKTHLPAYIKLQEEGLVKIVAICDIDEAALVAASAKFGVKRTFTDYSRMLEMDEIDAVDICTISQ